MRAQLESPLPASLPAGAATAVLLYGQCPGARRVELVVDGVRYRPSAAGMPRDGVFWGVVAVAARSEVGVAANGEIATLGRIEAAAREPPPGTPVDPDVIAVCMATHEPDPELLRAQVESLKAQTDERWVCVVSDDASSPERFAALREIVGDDERFVVSRSETRLGFYRNFERALRLAPPGAELVALCDQDDRWYADKLATLRAALGDAQMVFSDQRLVERDGRVRRASLWEGRENDHASLASLLVANSVTGAACLMRRDVVERGLPFPDAPGIQFHDHWLGLVALAGGEVAYVDRPLYDYVQHADAVFGEVSGGRKRDAPGWWGRQRAAYFLGYLGRVVQARALLVRCGDRLTPAERRELERFVAAERSPTACAWLAARAWRHRRATLASELELVGGIGWRWAMAAGARFVPRVRDASMPEPLSFEQRRLRRWRARA